MYFSKKVQLWISSVLLVIFAVFPFSANAGLLKDAAKIAAVSVAEKVVVKKIEESAAAKAAQLAVNREKGKARERITEEELRQQYPGASVQREQYLRDKDGNVAKDFLTGTGRRIDHVVVDHGAVVKKVETTSAEASKDAQIAKERRIMNEGGTFIRDRESGSLIDSGDQPSEVIRRE